MNRQTIYRLSMMLIPVISLFIAIVVIIYEAHRYQQLNHDLKVTTLQMAQLERLIKDLEAQPPITVVPTIAQTQVEQPDFLNVVRSYADVAHVQMTRWSNTGAGAAPSGKKLPGDVTSVTSSFEVAGKYNDLRHFLYALQGAPRLFTLTDMVWARNDKWPLTFLKFNLTRYVQPPGHAPLRLTPPASPSPTAQSGMTPGAAPLSNASGPGAAAPGAATTSSSMTSGHDAPSAPNFPSPNYISPGVHAALKEANTKGNR